MPTQLPDVLFYLGEVHPTEGQAIIKQHRTREIELARNFQVFTLLRSAAHLNAHAIYTADEISSQLYELAKEIDPYMAQCFPNNTLRMPIW